MIATKLASYQVRSLGKAYSITTTFHQSQQRTKVQPMMPSRIAFHAFFGAMSLATTSFAFTPITTSPVSSLLLPSSVTPSTSNNQFARISRLHAERFEGGDDEETRLNILSSRRKTIRSMLKNAENQRRYRLENDIVPEIDPETGKPIKSDSKAAITLTAFVVAAGAVTLRIGGRAALVSAVGLDFANDNPQLKDNMDQFLNYASGLDQGLEALAFIAAWTVVKVFCFDAGGVVLALSAGILFGGVLQGALFSAFAATVASSIAYFLAKVDSPFRNKALELLEEYPSLRGIEKVVAEDGLKAVLTLRLAPILPIPIGFYNYIYGVTNVPYFDFAGGIFLGSLKPYLLDSYLGVFGKEVVDGTVNQQGGLQDIILLAALGFSVLIGVFASELAGETWDSVKDEIDAEEKKKKDANESPEDVDDGIMRQFLGFEFPEWVIGAQLALQEADGRMDAMIKAEYNVKVWNCTDDNPPPFDKDPAQFPSSPEKLFAGSGFDGVAAICDGFVLSPALIKSYFKYADPLFDENEEIVQPVSLAEARSAVDNLIASKVAMETMEDSLKGLGQGGNLLTLEKPIREVRVNSNEKEELLKALGALRGKTESRLKKLNEEMDSL